MGDNEHDSWTVVSRKKKHERVNVAEVHNSTINNNNNNNNPIPVPPPEQQSSLQHQFNFNSKISEPCWFYNNGGCKNRDGTEKTSEECKYLHLLCENVKRPPHLSTRKPCDKYNLEGECKWHDNCKYSHRNLTPDEWSRFYPGMPYTLKTNVQKRLEIESKLLDIEGRMRIIEFKQDGISKDVQKIGQTLHQLVRKLGTI